MDAEIFALAETIWSYHLMKHQVAQADAILVLCSHDERVAERGAQLFLEGWAPLIIFSGGRGEITKKLWDEPEAVRFARIAMSLNVPRESILVEPNSTNTGENFRFTKKLLEDALGYQIAQEIPDEVWTAFEGLVRAGYDKYLVPQKGTKKATKRHNLIR